jgi:predicted DNA binding CopG/RHH family protein
MMPSDAENEKIHAAALDDPDAQPWTDAQLEAARDTLRFGHGGRTRINIRVKTSTLAEFKARAEKSGGNYQTLMNAALDEFLRGATLADVVRETIRSEMAGRAR